MGQAFSHRWRTWRSKDGDGCSGQDEVAGCIAPRTLLVFAVKQCGDGDEAQGSLNALRLVSPAMRDEADDGITRLTRRGGLLEAAARPQAFPMDQQRYCLPSVLSSLATLLVKLTQAGCPGLRHLDLSHMLSSWRGGGGWAELVLLLGSLPQLQRLDLHHNHFKDDDMEALVSALPLVGGSLRHLSLRGAYLHEGGSYEGAVGLALALQRLTLLTRLDLGSASLSNTALCEVAGILPGLHALRHLDLGGDVTLGGNVVVSREAAEALGAALQGLTSLTHLSMTVHDSSKMDGFAALAPGLAKHASSLRHLDLSGSQLQDAPCKAQAAAAVGQLTALTSLIALEKGTGATGAAATRSRHPLIMPPGSGFGAQLQHLDLSNHAFSVDDLHDLRAMFEQLAPALNQLALNNISLASHTAEAEANSDGVVQYLPLLTSALSELTQLTRLEFCLHQESAVRFCENVDGMMQALGRLTRLQHLDFGSMPLRYQCVDSLPEALMALTALRHLTLGRMISRQGRGGYLTYLASTLLQLQQLRCLSLRSSGLDAASAALLAPSLGALPQLRELWLGGNLNPIGPKGVAALTPQLQQLTALQCLDLESAGMGPAGVAHLAKALQHLTGLEQLMLASNDIEPRGAAALAPVLRTLTRLQHLDLGFNSLGQAGVAALVPALRGLVQLKHLSLARNAGPAQMAVLKPALSSLTALTHLNLRGGWSPGLAGALEGAPLLEELLTS